ncbi:beta-2 adrenergic receptor-like isoform X1 [Anneissia japonica]|uniref:beta-2 adrenergic receptor-like isoform X1 n=1 Tax=Anneissia japonica TaxID=1529436 RepID=UPI0014255690|nr:beta-2 adrenergic receptor-like isoform X1 [Anneissia japonica]
MLLDMTSSADYRWWNLFSDIESMNSSTHTYRSYLSYDNFPTYTEEWWHKAVVNACNWITIVFGSVAFVGNIFILMVALAANEIRKKRSSYLMVNLAIKDAMLGLLFLFQGICNYAVIQGIGVLIASMMRMVLLISSAFVIILIAMERCFAIIAPFQHRRYCTKKALINAIILEWIISISIVCLLCKYFLNNLPQTYFYVFILGSTTTILIYLLIFLIVKRHSSKNKHALSVSQNNKRKRSIYVIITFAFIAEILAICFILNAVVFILESWVQISIQTVVLSWVFYLLLPLNSAVNIFIYMWRIPEFRVAYKRILCSL